jgi:hypothetical protein
MSNDGFITAFTELKHNFTLVSLNLSTLDGKHRNVLNKKGHTAMADFLLDHKNISHLNLSSTSLGDLGLACILRQLGKPSHEAAILLK